MLNIVTQAFLLAMCDLKRKLRLVCYVVYIIIILKTAAIYSNTAIDHAPTTQLHWAEPYTFAM